MTAETALHSVATATSGRYPSRVASWFGGGGAVAPPCAAAAAHPPEANQDTAKRRDRRDSSSDPLLHCGTLPQADSITPCDLSIHAGLHLRSFSRNEQGLKFGVAIVHKG